MKTKDMPSTRARRKADDSYRELILEPEAHVSSVFARRAKRHIEAAFMAGDTRKHTLQRRIPAGPWNDYDVAEAGS